MKKSLIGKGIILSMTALMLLSGCASADKKKKSASSKEEEEEKEEKGIFAPLKSLLDKNKKK